MSDHAHARSLYAISSIELVGGHLQYELCAFVELHAWVGVREGVWDEFRSVGVCVCVGMGHVSVRVCMGVRVWGACACGCVWCVWA